MNERVKGLVAQSCPTLCDPMDCRQQVLLSMLFSRQEYWSGLPFPSPGDLSDLGINLGLLPYRQILHHLSQQGSPREKKGMEPGKRDILKRLIPHS